MLENRRPEDPLSKLTRQVEVSTHALQIRSLYCFNDAVSSVKGGGCVEKAVENLLAELTLEERLSLLDGDVPFWTGLRTLLRDRYNRHPFIHGSIPRLQIPGIRFTDGPRGIVMGSSTAFPVSMSRGATWDVELEKRVGQAIGLEGRAQGANYYAGVCINLPRHPAWGRVQETYGEDPILLGAMGTALAQGVGENLMVCVKHFALNSMENARFRVDVEVHDAALHEVYLPHFRTLIQEARVDSVMSSYNSVRGEWMGQNREFLIDILRRQWGFDGFVLSDFIFGLRDPILSVKNGLDVEAPFSQQRAQALQQAIESRQLDPSYTDSACSNILRKQIEYAARTDGWGRPQNEALVFSHAHRQLARETAAKGMVLLKNDTVGSARLLPIGRHVRRIALIGRLARAQNTGDRGSSHVHSPSVVSPLEGLQAAFPEAEILIDDADSAESAAKTASLADVTICIAGYTHYDEGEYVVPSFQSDPELLDLLPPCTSNGDLETYNYVTNGDSQDAQVADDKLVPGAGGDRQSLRLRSRDQEIISAVSKVTSNAIVSIVTAGAIVMEEWIDKVPAVLLAWYSGCEGGHALADVLAGRVDASGRLPFSIPRDESHLPSYDMYARKITYDRWFGQRLIDRLGVEARFPLGYGLSYTTFELDRHSVKLPTKVNRGTDKFSLQIDVANTGARAGRFVAQVYGRPGLPDFPARVLLGFAVCSLEPDEKKRMRISVSIRPLLRWTSAGWIRPGKTIDVEVGAYCGDSSAARRSILVDYS